MATADVKTAYTEKMQGLLKDAEAQVKKLGAEIDHVKADVKAEQQRQVQELHTKVAAAQTKLQELHKADEARWEKAKAEVERSWSDVKQSLQQAASHLRKQ